MSVNKAIIVGRLGQDPELKYTKNQTAVCTISVATSEKYKQEERTEWHSVVLFKHNAENVSKYLKKGSQVYIEGRIQTRKWQDKEGRDCYKTEIVANSVQFLESKKESNPNVIETANGPLELPSNSVSTQPEQMSFDDDDIPF